MDRSLHSKKGENGKFSQCNFLNKNRKGLSTIVITLILIALSLAAIVLVWSFVSSMIKGQIKNSEACYGNYDKIKLNGEYTCYERSGSNYYLRFSVGIADIIPEKVIVAVSSAGETKSYTITANSTTVAGLVMYPSNSTTIVLPGKNGGLTYKTSAFSAKIDSVKIAPVMNGVQCDVSDSIVEITDCNLMI
jgi:hypothetical protein